MKINLSSIKDDFGASISFSFVVSADQFSFGNTTPFRDKMFVSGQVVNEGSKWHVTGEITAPAHYNCDRCLQPFEKTEVISFDEIVSFTQEDEEAVLVVENEILDLTEYIRESLLLAQPIQSLCQENCRGLCPHCGINRNVEQCTCDEEQGDLRLQVLKRLLDS